MNVSRKRPNVLAHAVGSNLFSGSIVLAWGIGVGAKLYDLRVVAGAWPRRAAPPQSVKLLPYGPDFPVDPGKFFMPTSLATLVATFGALFCAWKTPLKYRFWLWSSAALIVAVSVFTVVSFWPRNCAACSRFAFRNWRHERSGVDTARTSVGGLRLVPSRDEGCGVRFSRDSDQ